MSFVIGLYHPPHEGRSLPSPLIYLGLVTCFGQENGAYADGVEWLTHQRLRKPYSFHSHLLGVLLVDPRRICVEFPQESKQTNNQKTKQAKPTQQQ